MKHIGVLPIHQPHNEDYACSNSKALNKEGSQHFITQK